MNRKKEGVRTITFDLGQVLKTKIDAYCHARSLTLAEVFRFYILNLPDEAADVDARAELVALRDRLQKKIDGLP